MSWFPRFSPDGRNVASGAGTLFLNGEPLGIRGWAPVWISNHSILFNGADQGLLQYEFGAVHQIDEREFSELAAGGGKWAGRYAPENALYLSDGRRVPNAGQPFIDAEGNLIYRVGDDKIEPARWRDTEVWGNGAGKVFSGAGDITVAPPEARPRLIPTPVGLWLLTMTHTTLRLRPVGEDKGYELTTGNDQNFHSDAIFLDGAIKVVYNDAHGGMHFWTQSLAEPRRAFGVPPPPPPPMRLPVPDKKQEAASFLTPRLVQLSTHDATRAHSFEQLNALARQLAAGDARWGLLEKTSGARVKDRASDVLVYRVSDTEAQVVDVIADAEGVNGPPRPTWIVKDLRTIRQWKAPFQLTDEPPPPPPLPNCDACQAENARLQTEVNALRALLTELELERDKLTVELAQTQAERDALKQRPESCPAWRAVGGPGWIRTAFGIRCEPIP